MGLDATAGPTPNGGHLKGFVLMPPERAANYSLGLLGVQHNRLQEPIIPRPNHVTVLVTQVFFYSCFADIVLDDLFSFEPALSFIMDHFMHHICGMKCRNGQSLLMNSQQLLMKAFAHLCDGKQHWGQWRAERSTPAELRVI